MARVHNDGVMVNYKRSAEPPSLGADEADIAEDVVRGQTFTLLAPSFNSSGTGLISLPKALLPFLSVLCDLDMSSPESTASSKRTGRGRGGRRAAVKVPCDDCIKRASEQKDDSNIELCERCTNILHRPRGRKQDAPVTRRMRRSSTAIIDTALGVRTDPVALPWSEDRAEQHALQFFVRHSAAQLAGYFDSPFWERMVLQAGRHEPAVKHAIAAVGALHEKLLTGAVTPGVSQDRRTRFALEQCNKSIQHLTKPEGDKSPNLRLMLTTCVLFTCFEAMQGHCEQAIAHATQGYSLLQQYAMDPENNRFEAGAFAVELDQLCLMMRRLQTQSKGLMGKDYNIIPDAETMKLAKPTHFATLHEARSGLELVMNKLTVYFLDLELDDQFYDLVVANAEKHLIFAPWLEAWESAFTELLSRKQSSMSENDRKGAMVLKAHHIVAEILSNVDLSLGELGWDAFQDKFAAIVDLGTAILEGSKTSDISTIDARWKANDVFISSANAELSFSLGIVDPLYEVCYRCRDPQLRRRALDLLARHPRQEGMWSSWSAWKVGKYLMRLEEQGHGSPPLAAGDIRSENRVTEAWIDFSVPALDSGDSDGRKGRVMYKRTQSDHMLRQELNPGLFAGEAGGFELGQMIDFAEVAAPSDLSVANGTPSSVPDRQFDFGPAPSILVSEESTDTSSWTG